MRAPLVAAGIVLLMLTWLSLRGMNLGAQRFDHVLQGLDHFAMVERTLQRDILSARVGLLRNYDPLVQETNALRSALDELREATAGNKQQKGAVERLASSIGRQEDLTEQFKSANALMRNSLAYFGLISARLSTSGQSGPSLAAINALSAAMLNLTLHTSTANALEVKNRVQALSPQVLIISDADSAQALLAHGNLLHDLLPATDNLLGTLYTLPTRPEQETLRAMLLEDQLASRQLARQFRLLLYALSLLLLGLLVHLGLKLRARAFLLHWRAALEHVIAGISTSLINCPPDEMGSRIEEALSRLAGFIGADRAYFVVSREPARVYAWCRDGAVFPSGWPGDAAKLAGQFAFAAEPIIHIPDVTSLPRGPNRDALASAGIRGWICVSSMNADDAGNVLGFDALQSPITTPSTELRLLRMAFDAIVNAINRELLEREGARLETQLQQARRMETVGALASGVAHNFNNIVGAILGYTEIAESHIQTDSRAIRSLAEIRRAGARGRDLIDQILAFGRGKEVAYTPLRVKALLAEAGSLLGASLPAQIELIVHEAPEAAIVSGDSSQLQQVILNLCHNAAQAIDETGRVEIETDIREIAQALPLAHGRLVPGSYAVISVSDTGRGMTKAVMARIFAPFFTTRLTGNGLGLATACEIVREHGGAIDVRSTPGTGSCFEVWLPCSSTSDRLTPEYTAGMPRLGHGETVLVIDDDRDRLLREEEMLAALGYEPVGFANPCNALAACRTAPQRFDAFLVGHLLPTASTLALASALHEIAPDRPILLATASSSEIAANALITAGISEIVRWPLVASEMAATLTECFAAPSKRSANYESNANPRL